MISALPLTQQLFRTAQVRELDRLAIEEQGIAGIVLMKRAASAMLTSLQLRWPSAQRPLVFCGGGNNGGDGYLFAALAQQKNLRPRIVYTSDPAKLSGDAQRAWRFAVEAGVSMQAAAEFDVQDADVLVDALLGTGLQADIRPAIATLIDWINQRELPVLAADVPSGLNSDTGAVMGTAVIADCTVSFVGLKAGLFTASGRAYCGDIVFDRLEIPDAVYRSMQPMAELLSLARLKSALPQRRADAHKGRHGHVLIIGGDQGMGGAAILSARAALHCGAGLVSLITRPEHVAAVLAQQPEVMSYGVDKAGACLELVNKASVVVIGPGMGATPWAEQLLHTVLTAAADKPRIIDADALNLLADNNWFDLLGNKQTVYTPHPGEAARLIGSSSLAVQQNRFATLIDLSNRLPGTVLLKGSGTLISRSHAATALCPYGNAGMATGGMGDILSGVIGALCAQGLSPQQATELGVCLHAAAADRAVAEHGGTVGLLATDLLSHLRYLLNHPADLRDAAGLMELG